MAPKCDTEPFNRFDSIPFKGDMCESSQIQVRQKGDINVTNHPYHQFSTNSSSCNPSPGKDMYQELVQLHVYHPIWDCWEKVPDLSAAPHVSAMYLHQVVPQQYRTINVLVQSCVCTVSPKMKA